MKNNNQSLVKMVWEMNLKRILDEFTGKQVQALKMFLGTLALLMFKNELFYKK